MARPIIWVAMRLPRVGTSAGSITGTLVAREDDSGTMAPVAKKKRMVTVAPWMLHNLGRFEHPVLRPHPRSGLDVVMAKNDLAAASVELSTRDGGERYLADALAGSLEAERALQLQRGQAVVALEPW